MPKIPSLNFKLIIFLTLLWPILQIFVFRLRFSSVTLVMVLESLQFLPLGLFSGLIMGTLLKGAKTKREKLAILLGYIFAIPTAIFTSLLGGLVLNPIIGATVFGLIPLVAGMFLGFFIAKRIDKIKLEDS